jgi:hypothetical protein
VIFAWRTNCLGHVGAVMKNKVMVGMGCEMRKSRRIGGVEEKGEGDLSRQEIENRNGVKLGSLGGFGERAWISKGGNEKYEALYFFPHACSQPCVGVGHQLKMRCPEQIGSVRI